MSTIEVNPPFPVFADIDGQPLEAGYIWIGTANLNPQTNPINVYWDADLTVVATQPIRTLAGYPSNSGTPARFYVNQDYSIRVMNRNGSTIYTSLNGNVYPGTSGALSFNATGTGAQTVFATPFIPSQIFINGVYQNQNTYSFASGNITFTQAPPSTSIIEFLY
jgi:hypothetical protein